MGAVYGTNGPLIEGLEKGHDGDPVGNLVALSSSFDKAVWTSYYPTGNVVDPFTGLSMSSQVPIFNADTKIELRKLYQWRIVTKEQVLASLRQGDVDDGLSTNLTYLITDRGFERNDWNLTPRRYFDLKTEVSHRSFEDIAADYNRIIAQKNAIRIRMNRTAAKRLGYDCMDVEKPDLSASFGVVGQKVLKEDNISFGADDGIRIQISTKDGIHPLIIDFLNHWKQMIMYLNTEESRYLAEFRDALLPELINGRIEVKNEE